MAQPVSERGQLTLCSVPEPATPWQVITLLWVQPKTKWIYEKRITFFVLCCLPSPCCPSHSCMSTALIWLREKKSLMAHSLATKLGKRGIAGNCDAVGSTTLLSALVCVCVCVCVGATESLISGNRPGREQGCEQEEKVDGGGLEEGQEEGNSEIEG